MHGDGFFCSAAKSDEEDFYARIVKTLIE